MINCWILAVLHLVSDAQITNHVTLGGFFLLAVITVFVCCDTHLRVGLISNGLFHALGFSPVAVRSYVLVPSFWLSPQPLCGPACAPGFRICENVFQCTKLYDFCQLRGRPLWGLYK